MGLTPLLLILIVAMVLIWLDGARARELATQIARGYCDTRGLQFLDDTVARVRIGVRWTAQGLRIRRMFRFDFSLEGVGRRSGHVLMMGGRFEAIDDGLPRASESEDMPESPPDDSPVARTDTKVIPFRRPRD